MHHVWSFFKDTFDKQYKKIFTQEIAQNMMSQQFGKVGI
jgi:hypothetical protein